MSTVLIGVGGAAGAVARYAITSFVKEDTFPIGTLCVNTVGSFLLGLVLFGTDAAWIRQGIGIGFCGAFTTYSTFSLQTVSLFEESTWDRAVGFAGLSLGFGLGGFLLAWVIMVG